MYSLVRNLLLRVMNVSPEPPAPPPGAGSVVRTFRASPRYLHYKLVAVYVGAPIALLLELGPLLLEARDSRLWLILALVLAVPTILGILLAYFFIRLEYDMRHYVLTDRSLRIREGVWIVRESTLTFANVQNIRVQQGPLQQLFGIADVMVDTAGGGAKMKEAGEGIEGQHRGAIRGVQNAAEIRDLVVGLLKRYRDAGLGDPEDERRQAAGGAAASPAAGARLREILEEVRAVRAALAPGPQA